MQIETLHPNLFIVGAAKSGTSAIAYFTSQHPEVYMASVKEPYFFVQNPEISLQNYRGLFKRSYLCPVAGEASTGYLFDSCSARLIKTFNPSAKIVIVLRRPEDMAYSLWRYMRTNGNEKAAFMDALRDTTRTVNDTWRAGRAENYLYLDRVMYADQVERYFQEFGKENVKVFIYERFDRSPVQIMRELFVFLGVAETFVPDLRRVNVGGVSRFRVVQRLHQARYPILKRIVPFSCRRFLRRMVRTFNVKPQLSEAMTESERRFVRLRTAEDIAKLSTILGDDLVEWG